MSNSDVQPPIMTAEALNHITLEAVAAKARHKSAQDHARRLALGKLLVEAAKKGETRFHAGPNFFQWEDDRTFMVDLGYQVRNTSGGWWILWGDSRETLESR